MLLLCVLVLGCGRKRDGAVDFAVCLRELTDPASFAVAPLGRAHLISTYDRTGGNNDGGLWQLSGGPDDKGYVRIAEMEGPGIVTRIWMTSVPGKEWFFFFDGEESPRLTLTRSELFGGKFPFVPPISGRISGGYYSYLPLPYEKSLRIVVRAPGLQPTSKAYCHVNYRSLPADTAVQSFPAVLSRAERKLVESACEAWNGNEESLRKLVAKIPVKVEKTLGPQERVAWLEQSGSGTLEAFHVTLDTSSLASASMRSRILRELVLRIYWDGAAEPSVEAPLGDFFCNAFHRRRFSSLPLGRVDDTYVCRFPMPYRSGARAELANEGSGRVGVRIGYRTGSRPRGAAYFHARWQGAESVGRPLDVLSAEGRGHLAGCYVNAIGTDGTWFILEGDETIRLDGEAAPSWHGTGLEDYFNGAWYYKGIFDLPLCGLVEKAPIRTDQYRFHLLDRVPFDKSLDMQFEFGHANQSKGYMSSTAYWYQERPAVAGSDIPAGAKRFPPPDPLAVQAFMADVFQLEREGLLEEARERCLLYAEQFARRPVAQTVRLRAAAYAELLGEEEAAIAVYRDCAAQKKTRSHAPGHAANLLWLREDRTHALLGLQVNGRHTVHLSGKKVGEGDHPGALAVSRIVLEPGTHELAAEVTPTRADAWFSAHLRMASLDISTDETWECALTKPVGWPQAWNDPDVQWTTCPKPGWNDILPRITMWRFVPNPYVNMQSGKQLLRPWKAFGKGHEQATVYLRKRFTVPLVQ